MPHKAPSVNVLYLGFPLRRYYNGADLNDTFANPSFIKPLIYRNIKAQMPLAVK